MAEKYRVGIIGCGSISRAHANGYKALDSVELVAGADIHPEALKEFGEEFSVTRKYADYKEMLDREHLDIVSICTWPGLHAEMTIAAAESKVKGILCEKPMCLNLGEADAMIAACEKNGTKLAIAHQRRFRSSWTEARRLISEGVIGQPTILSGRVRDGLTNWGTHVIDCMRYVLGDPETEWVIGQVERNTDRYERANRIEDLCMGLICFAGGVRGVIESDLIPSEGTAGGCTIYGTEGLMYLNESVVRFINKKMCGWQELKPPGGDPFTAQEAELISWIEGRTGHRGEGKQARYTMEIMMAIYESARVHGMVRMPLETEETPLELMIEEGDLSVSKPGSYDIRAFLIRS